MKTEAQKKLQEVWYSMRYRCTNPNDSHWDRYGGRGITVCEEWRDSKAFIAWALENGYEQGLTLDRIDNDKGYSPDNCRWVTRYVQQNNTCRNRPVTLCGVTYNYSTWARLLGMPKSTFRKRLDSGWSDYRILHEPVRRRNR